MGKNDLKLKDLKKMSDIDISTPYATVNRLSPSIALTSVAVGLFSPILVSPIVAIVDGAIINSVNGDGTPIFKGIANGFKELCGRPHKFFASYKWQRLTFYCWLVYGGTYASGNLIQAYDEASHTHKESAKMRKVLLTSVVNMGLTAFVKDPAIVRLMQKLSESGEVNKASLKPPRPMWWLPRGLFCFRDFITMFAAFYVADSVGEWLMYKGEGQISPQWARRMGTFGVPVGLQTVSTPIHLLALNLVEMPQASLMVHGAVIREKYFQACTSRMARIFPAIGLGSNLNNEARDRALRWLAAGQN